MICLICLEENQKSKFDEYHDNCFRKFFGTIKISPILPFNRKEFFEERSRQSSKRIGLSGVQPKLGIKIIDDVLETTNLHFTHIIKPSPETWPQVAENEHLTMSISKLMGIDTAEFGLVRFSDGELVYVTKRFDLDGTKKRIHQEDMMQAMGIHGDLENNAKYESKSYEDVCQFLTRYSSIAVTAKLFERIFFNFMVSNDDFHLKNISIKYDSRAPGGVTLTPHYDSVNTGIYGIPQRELACDLFTENNGFSEAFNTYGFHSRKCFEEFAEKINLSKKVIEKVFKKFEAQGEKIDSLVERSFLTDERKIKYKKELTDRREKFFLKNAPS